MAFEWISALFTPKQLYIYILNIYIYYIYIYILENMKNIIYHISARVYFFSPPARWGSQDFIRVTSSSSSFLPSSSSQQRTPDLSGHCRTSSANSRSQWALPDRNHELRISVGTAAPQHQIECQNRCQKERQNRCQIECQNRKSE